MQGLKQQNLSFPTENEKLYKELKKICLPQRLWKVYQLNLYLCIPVQSSNRFSYPTSAGRHVEWYSCNPVMQLMNFITSVLIG
ncbi:hypothetical protein pdam_00008690 [Pocillopora damicornis]|uniref:Uncharacterized protein n=1 Tax=Pocillopora damicornis TaxID=46731 RepID=A0A3M6TG72_POCDA|nr:hypothetical protein pdam_00008690 [Pocillopora damicornis]